MIHLSFFNYDVSTINSCTSKLTSQNILTVFQFIYFSMLESCGLLINIFFTFTEKKFLMKKKFILFLLTAIIACNNKTKQETKNNSLVWADNVESTVPMVKDTLWNKEDWEKTFRYDKKAIFASVTNGILSGKLKAYSSYPDGELTTTEFKSIIEKWDSTATVEDTNNPGTMINAPILMKLTADDIVQLRFNEKVELDTVGYTINKKVSFITFIGYHINNSTKEVDGLKKLFDVKLNDASKEKNE